MNPQNGEGLRGPGQVTPGGVITVEVGPNETTVELNFNEETISYPVSPGKAANIPVPQVPPGTVIGVTIGRGLRQLIILVEVVTTAP